MSFRHGHHQTNLPVVHGEPQLRNHGTQDSTPWLDSASHTDTYTITERYKVSDEFV